MILFFQYTHWKVCKNGCICVSVEVSGGQFSFLWHYIPLFH